MNRGSLQGFLIRDMPGQDYADQRYYTASAGRFYTPDRAGLGAVDMKNPTSWNMYAYTNDDPVNFVDPRGTCDTSTDTDFSVTVCGGDAGSLDPSSLVLPGEEGERIPIGSVGAFLLSQSALKAAVANTAARLSTAVAAASIALLNPNCAGLFGLDSNAPSPLALLNSIATGINPSAYFTENFYGPDPSNPNHVVNAITQRTAYSLQNGVLTNVGYQTTQVVVAFNYYPGAPFNAGTITADATTVLHELGHVYEALYGPGSTYLVDDSAQAQGSIQQANAASAFNTQLVQTNCFHGGH